MSLRKSSMAQQDPTTMARYCPGPLDLILDCNGMEMPTYGPKESGLENANLLWAKIGLSSPGDCRLVLHQQASCFHDNCLITKK
ncbi:unnamed protein product [Darwinula stevensoni]|uniref:Uncharacterized protein n=1 Tax=Darwinula stevensoni TaxID=69355 RepID=A0A7R9AAS7_9CRUS|nr:unnamed protein product [Darwinula stevensoni]CAG0898731.1 unnamed protein product [Darwinula stevensoni]